MNQAIRRAPARLALSHLFCLLGALTLAGCGGGGGGGGSGSEGDSTPPPSPGDYLSVGLTASSSSTNKTLLLVDADHPTPPRLSITLSNRENLFTSAAVTVDPATLAYTYIGETMLYCVSNHQLFQVSLRKADTTVAQRISSLSTACSVDEWYPLQLNGANEGWVEVTEAGLDGDCTLPVDNRKVYVRTGTPATTAATTLPAGVRLLDMLPSASLSSTSGFVAIDTRGATPKLTHYSAELALLGDVAGGNGETWLEMLSFVPGGQFDRAAFVRTGSTLRRMSWTDSSVTLLPVAYTFTGMGPSSNSRYPLDSHAMYFVDGLQVRKIDAGGNVSLLATLDPARGSTAEVHAATANHVVIGQGTSDHTTLLTLGKNGGTPLPLVTGTDIVSVLGLHGNEVVYATHAAGSAAHAMWRVQPDGSSRRFIAGNTGSAPMRVFQRAMNYAGFQLEAVVWCEPAAGASDCRNGSLRSHNLATGATLALGNFSHAASSASWYIYGWGFAGSPLLIQTYSYAPPSYGLQEDLYLAQPERSNSLTRLSNNLP